MAISEQMQEILSLQESYTTNMKSPEMRQRMRLVQTDAPAGLREILQEIGQVNLKCEGSNGIGNPAKVPWMRVFLPSASPAATKGFYLSYLFSFDGKKLVVSLNQGTSKFSRTKTQSIAELAREQLKDFTSSLEDAFQTRLLQTRFDLASNGGVGDTYPNGDIYHLEYAHDDFPTDSEIKDDLENFTKLLNKLYELDIYPNDEEVSEIGELDSVIFWSNDQIDAVIASLTDKSPQVVLQGPPGTGKTYVAKSLAQKILSEKGGDPDQGWQIIQFHPTYGYEEFIEGLRPVVNEDGNLEFKVVPGSLKKLIDEMAEDSQPRVLIIDEMNRANLPRVFGELLYGLEYRDEPIRLMYSESFAIPSNLFVIGTMNTADRSIRSIDMAIRRRFDFYDVEPSVEILKAFYKVNQNDVGEKLFDGFVKLNDQLRADLGRHHTIGHSFFMADKFTKKDLNRVWDRQIHPLILEFFFDREDLASTYVFSNFWS